MILHVNSGIRLELITHAHALPIYSMVVANRNYLGTWLPFAHRMLALEHAETFVKGSMERNKLNIEYAFVVYEHHEPVGRIGVYKIDPLNHIGEIGYWLIENKQGKGIITQSCKTIIDFCFDTLNLNRIELKCGVHNTKSKAIALHLGFTQEGLLREAEWLHNSYIDLYLFALVKSRRIV